MKRESIEYSWLKDNEALYYDDVKGVYHYEMSCPDGIHRFYISTKIDPRPISRELIDEYAMDLGIIDAPEDTAVIVSEPTIEYDPEKDCMRVHDGCGNCTEHPLPENPADYHTLGIQDFPKNVDYSLDNSITRWAETLFMTESIYTPRHEYLNVAGYDKVVIIGNLMVVYTGDEYELIRVPEYDWDRRLIMSDDLIELLSVHNKQKAG